MDQGALQQVIQVLEQYYNPSANVEPSKRSQMEQFLQQSFQGPKKWQQGLFLIQTATFPTSTVSIKQPDIVQFFGLQLVENCLVDKTWFQNDDKERDTVKQFLYQFLLNQYRTNSRMTNLKIMKVLIEIAKLEWPETYPQFFNSIFELCSKSETILIGLQLLKTVAEEFVSDREDLPHQRKIQLKQHLMQLIPQIFVVFRQVLETMFGVFQQNPQIFEKNLNSSKDIVLAILDAQMQFLSWIPLDKFWEPNFMRPVYQFAQASITLNQDICIACIQCINEIVSKNFVPKQSELFIMETVSVMMQLLMTISHVSKEEQEEDSCSLSDDIDYGLLEQIIQFFNMFFNNHIARIQQTPNFPFVEFFTQFFNFTLLQKNPEEFQHVVEVWNIIIQHVMLDQSKVTQYSALLIQVFDLFLKKSQFTVSGSGYLLDLDDIKKNADGYTDLDLYHNEMIDNLANLCETLPTRNIPVLFSTYQTIFGQLYNNSNLPTFEQTAPKLAVVKSEAHRRCYYCVKDGIFLLKLFSRLSALFGQNLETYANHVLELLSSVTALLQFFITNKIISKGVIYESMFIEGILLLQMFEHWLQQYIRMNKVNPAPAIQQYVNSVLNISYQVLHPSALKINTDIIKQVAVLFHRTCSTLFSYSMLSQWEPFRLLQQNLRSNMEYYCSQYDLETAMSIVTRMYTAFCNSILHFATEKEKRLQIQQLLTPHLVAPWVSIVNQEQLEKDEHYRIRVAPALTAMLEITKSILDANQTTSKEAKELLFEALKPILASLFKCFEVFVKQQQGRFVLDRLLSLFLISFRVLKSQLGQEYMEKTVQLFLNLFNHYSIDSLLSDMSGKSIMTNYLELLDELCMDGAGKFIRLTPMILDACRKVVVSWEQSASKNMYIDLLQVLYRILYYVLLNHWQYFFNKQQNNSFVSEQSAAEFRFIMECFLKSFQSNTDVESFKNNLKYLEDLDKTRNLFKELLAKEMLFPFLFVLTNVLVQKSFNLLKEDVISVIYSMFAVNWNMANTFLIMHLKDSGVPFSEEQKQKLLQQFAAAVQQPNPVTFAQKFSEYVNDFVYYKKILTTK